MNFSAIRRESAVGRVLRTPLRLIPKGSKLPILQGKLRGKRWIVGAGSHGLWLGSYEYPKGVRFEREITAGDVVFDVGAHAGFYTMLAAMLVGPAGLVVAIEPVPRNVRYLRAHLQINMIRNVSIVEAAAWDREGSVRFDEGPEASMGHVDIEGELEVRAVRLDDLQEGRKLPPPSVMKVDVEGAELQVLRGAERLLREARTLLFLATHGPDVEQDCIRLLASFEYRIEVLAAGELLAHP